MAHFTKSGTSHVAHVNVPRRTHECVVSQRCQRARSKRRGLNPRSSARNSQHARVHTNIFLNTKKIHFPKKKKISENPAEFLVIHSPSLCLYFEYIPIFEQCSLLWSDPVGARQLQAKALRRRALLNAQRHTCNRVMTNTNAPCHAYD